MAELNKRVINRIGMRREALFVDVKVSLSMVGLVRILSIAISMTLGLFSSNDLHSQDFASLLDVSHANAESLRNYDVSYRVTTIADLPADKSARAELEKKHKELNLKLQEEIEILGRIVVDKGDSMNPERLVSAMNYRELVNGKRFAFSEFIIWESDTIYKLTTLNPRNSAGQGQLSLKNLYKDEMIPFFEIFHRNLLPPSFEGYWDDHSAFWEWAKAKTANLEVVNLPNGRMRVESPVARDRIVTEYDPISSLVVYETYIPVDPKTGNDDFNFSLPARITWEKIKNVYCLKGIVARNRDIDVMNDTVTSFFWHQCNEESFDFPVTLKEDLSLQSCTKFLTEGQSLLTGDR